MILQNAHELITSYRQNKWKKSILFESQIFTKLSSLRPRLSVPMFQIPIQHLKVSLFVLFFVHLYSCCF